MAAFSAPTSSVIASDDRVLHAVVVACLGRYRGQSRLHTGSDLKVFLAWTRSASAGLTSNIGL